MNKTTPLISVILPVYNVADYIGEAMDSILRQTIQDFEILVIDDCSTDNTLAIIQAFEDNRIKIIEKLNNKGLVDSLNTGIENAKGKYIARMDGDDISHVKRFEKQMKVLEENNNIKACGCWLKEFGSRNNIIRHKEYHQEIVANLLLKCSMSLGAVMFKAEWLKPFKFREEMKHVEDYDFWARTAWLGNFYNIQETLYYYRVHESQVSNHFNHLQRLRDVNIKMLLFNKLNFDTSKFDEKFLQKMFYQQHYFTVDEFGRFVNFLNKTILLNEKSQVFDSKEFKKVVLTMREQVISLVYLKNIKLGITKSWRIKALKYLSIKELIQILSIKIREKLKSLK